MMAKVKGNVNIHISTKTITPVNTAAEFPSTYPIPNIIIEGNVSIVSTTSPNRYSLFNLNGL